MGKKKIIISKCKTIDEQKMIYENILQSIHYEYRNDVYIKSITSIYYKFGGEKLARQSLELLKKRFHDGVVIKPQKEKINYDETGLFHSDLNSSELQR